MSVQDERELRERLGGLLDVIEPRQVPLAAAVRQGRGIRTRRRASAAAGLAVIAGGAVLVPAILHGQQAAPPATPHAHYVVTVSPPAKGAAPGTIATGSVNGWHWQATLTGSGKDLTATFGKNFAYEAVNEPSFAAGTPAILDGLDDNAGHVGYVGPVAPSVRYLTVTLSNGQVLTLRPQPRSGHRYAAMVLPAKLDVTEAVAYGRAGEISYAIPFNYQGMASFQTWLRPGQASLAQATARIGAGGSGRSHWTATAYLGPWGLCGEVLHPGGGGGGFCQSVGSDSPVGLVSAQFGSGPGGVEIGVARPDVAYLLITKSDGSVQRADVAHLSGYRYGLFALIAPGHPTFASWSAYDAHSNRLGGGAGDPARFR